MKTRKVRPLGSKGVILVMSFILINLFLAWGTQTADCKTRVVVAQGAEATRLDPDLQRETTTQNVVDHIYDALLAMGPNGKIVPALAESWRYLNDTTLELKLRKGVKFSNGEPFNAEVAKYNLDRVLGKLPGAAPTPLVEPELDWVKEYEIVDDYTIQIISKYPAPLALAYLTQKMMVPFQYTKQDNFASLATKPVGTGPYVLKSWMKGSELVLEARKDCWKGIPKIDEIVFRPIPEDSTRIAELKVGNIDLITNVKPDNLEEVKAIKDVDVRSVSSNRTTHLHINTAIAKMKDIRVRKAINYAVDVESLTKNVLGGNGHRVSVICPKSMVGWDPEEKFYPYDPEMAKKLLAEAGFPDGMDITILTPRGRYVNDVAISEAIAGMLTKVGIRTKVNAVEFGIYIDIIFKAHEKEPELVFISWGNALSNTLYDLIPGVLKGGVFNSYTNEKIDSCIEKASSTVDPKKHVEYLRLALREMWIDPPFVYLYNMRDNYGVNKRLVWEPRSDERIYLFDAYVK